MDTYAALCKFMQQPSPQVDSRTKNEIESFFGYCMDGMDTDSEKLLATLLIKALNKRINSEFIGQNIYLGKYEVSQIQLFNILIEKLPFVRFSQQITNQAIVEAMQDCEEATVIDIGMGQGTQMLNIIEQAKSLSRLKKIHFVGIEPFGEALRHAEKNILARNGQVPFGISFTGIHDGAENVDFSALNGLRGKIIVNASLALHHIQSDRQRSDTFASIRQINPDALILIEPNVNHYEPDFFARFKNCYNHFYSIFQVIDHIENLEQADKNALKLFFGREIEDIIGKEEKDRYEKHEPATHWIERLHQNRFSLRRDLLKVPVEAGCGVKISYHKEGFLGFTFKEETVLAVIYAN
ncbi:MAG: hypothetical protein JNJ90_17705 [Saprospiraceae bacterium]|nr:hypothetical protein [Saprospiraceae bacterium]